MNSYRTENTTVIVAYSPVTEHQLVTALERRSLAWGDAMLIQPSCDGKLQGILEVPVREKIRSREGWLILFPGKKSPEWQLSENSPTTSTEGKINILRMCSEFAIVV